MRLTIITLFAIIVAIGANAQKKKSTKAKPGLPQADSIYLTGTFREAITIYEAALKETANRKDVRAFYRLGMSYMNLKEYDNALRAFNFAWSINTSHPGLRIAMARAWSAKKEVGKAIVMLDSAMATGFANHKLLETDPELENVRNDPRYNTVHEKMLAIAYPCRALPAAHAFDFWLGDWDVFATSALSVKTGFNSVTRASEGCVILENWESIGPHRGMSINYYEPVTGKWQQKWAGSAQDIQEFSDGVYKDSAMRFTFTGRNPDGTLFKGRLTFTDMEPGKVRQHSERTDDEGKTWQTLYDFTYIRRNN